MTITNAISLFLIELTLCLLGIALIYVNKAIRNLIKSQDAMNRHLETIAVHTFTNWKQLIPVCTCGHSIACHPLGGPRDPRRQCTNCGGDTCPEWRVADYIPV